MPTELKTQSTNEPVHVQAGQPPTSPKPVSVDSVTAPTPAAVEKPEPAATSRPLPPKPQPGKVNKSPKKTSSGVGMAITATVIIVLGLAGLAVLAYVKTQK
jgi:hypothetical protein